MKKEYWIALIKSGGNYYVLSSKEGEVNVRNTEKERIEEFHKKYNGNDSIAGIINNIQFQPSIIQMSIEEMGGKLFDLDEGVRVNKVSSVSGSFYGIGCNRDKKNIEMIFEKGTKVNP
ncbi:MAG: hypothetical protein NUV46_01185 [Nanoarchaeota archaeon]|nr:hypothetical protein [Nanoarchaeota archaeon]